MSDRSINLAVIERAIARDGGWHGLSGFALFREDLDRWEEEAILWFGSFNDYPEEEWHRYSDEMADWWPRSEAVYLSVDARGVLKSRLRGVCTVLLGCVRAGQDCGTLLQKSLLMADWYDLFRLATLRDQAATVIQRHFLMASLGPEYMWGKRSIAALAKRFREKADK